MCRILIADKDAEAMTNLLDWSACGVSSVITASTYLEAVNKAMDLHPHAALVSHRLGDYTGCELATHLRSAGLRTAFCIVADEGSSELIREAMRAGAQDYLLRPLRASEVQAFLERVRGNAAGTQMPEPGIVRGETDPVLGVPYTELSRITNKIILIVKSGYRTPQTLTGIAESLQMSSKYIGRVFLKDTGIKFSEYLMAYRMLEARKLIVGTQEKISVIAGMVGYVQQNNFYIHFKNYFGVSPSALRNYEAPQESESQ